MSIDTSIISRFDFTRKGIWFCVNSNKTIRVGDLPNNLTHLELGGKYNKTIGVGVLPDGLTHLILGENYNRKLRKGALPNSLLYLKFSEVMNINRYTRTIDGGVLPPNLQILELYNYYGELKIDIFPSTLTHLYISIRDKKIPPGVLPDSLTHLHCLDYRIEKLEHGVLPKNLKVLVIDNLDDNIILNPGVFPNSLDYLKFGTMFNSAIGKNVLPNNLTHLVFGDYYNKRIGKNVLPKSLTHLVFGSYFSQYIGKNVLPDSLTNLTFGENYNHILEEGVLPKNLIYLTLGECYNKKIKNKVLPDSLLHLQFEGIRCEIDHLPPNLLSFQCEKISNKINLSTRFFPDTLTTLKFTYDRKLKPGFLPNSLEYLSIGYKYNLEPGILPINLKKLELIYECENIGINVLPPNLESIIFRGGYVGPLLCNGVKLLPPTIQNVTFYYNPDYDPDSQSNYIFNHREFYIHTNVFVMEGGDSDEYYYINYDVTKKIRKNILIDDCLPNPIADEILNNIKQLSLPLSKYNNDDIIDDVISSETDFSYESDKSYDFEDDNFDTES